MKPAEVRRLAETHDAATLATAAEALENGETPAIEVHGEDEGEQLTHLMLAGDLAAAVAGGEDARVAFRAVMQRVRGILDNG